jgi:mRNA-degrading endonuclease toxin of MazEF toxin-antitoxin module
VSDAPFYGEVVYVKNEGLPRLMSGDQERRWIVVMSDLYRDGAHTLVVKVTTTRQSGPVSVQIPEGEGGFHKSYAICNTIIAVHRDFINRESRDVKPGINMATMRKISIAMRKALDAVCDDDS